MSGIQWKTSVPKRKHHTVFTLRQELKFTINSLDALSTFIQSQRTLLAQTLADIDKLQELRSDIALHPDDGVEMIPHFVDQVRLRSLWMKTARIDHSSRSSTLQLPN